MAYSVKRREFVNSVRIARISYLARQGLDDAQIKEHYKEANKSFIKMIADRTRLEMEELN